jgi:serine protease Do
MSFFKNHKYTIAILIGLALGAALVAGGIFAYNAIYPSNSAEAGTSYSLPDNSNVPLPTNIPDIVEKASNAVVYIETTVESKPTSNPFFNDPFFRHFFGDDFLIQPTPKVSKGVGTGFIIDSKGYIVTNEHVISEAKEISVIVKGYDKPFKATLVGKDFELDLAVLKISAAKPLPYIALGDSEKMKVGEWVIAIGNPYRLDHTVTVGVVSAKGRPITILDESTGKNRVYKNLIQTDAAINPGNSGGPLLSLQGEVIGINTAVNAQAQGIGFAIPINTAKDVLEDLIKRGSIARPYIGVGLEDVTKDLANYFGLTEAKGAIVSYVFPGGPAEKSGIQQGDIILKINDKAIKNSADVSEIVSKTKINDKLVLYIYRKGQYHYIPVTVGQKPS